MKRRYADTYERPSKRAKRTPRTTTTISRGWTPRNFIQGELKFSDITITTAISSTGVFGLLNGLVLSNDATGRVGRQIAIKSLHIRSLHYVTTGTGVDQVQRMILFQDMQSNGVAPVWTDLLVGDVYSNPNLANRNRFRIIRDKTFYLNATAEPNSGHLNNLHIKFPGRGLITTYNAGNGGAVADIATNALYLYFVSNIGAGATAGGVIGSARLRYQDN